MPKYTENGLNSRSAYDSQGKQQAVAITAQPLDTAVNRVTNPHAQDGMMQWANSLMNFGQNFEGLGLALHNQSQAELKQKDIINAKNNALQAFQMGVPHSVAINAISPDSSPVYIDQMKTSLGEHYAQADINQWTNIQGNPDAAEAYAKEHGVEPYQPANADPNYHTKYAQDFFDRASSGVNDPLSKLSYNSQVDGAVQKTTELASATSIDNAAQLRQGALSGIIQGGFDSREQDPNYFQTKILPEAIRLNVPRGKAEELHANYIGAQATNSENPQPVLLNLLDQPGEINPKTGEAFPSWKTRHLTEWNHLRDQALSHLKTTVVKDWDTAKRDHAIEVDKLMIKSKADPLSDPAPLEAYVEKLRTVSDKSEGTPGAVASAYTQGKVLLDRNAKMKDDWSKALQGNTLGDFKDSNSEYFPAFFAQAVKESTDKYGDPDTAAMHLASMNNMVAPNHVSAIKGALAAAQVGDFTPFEQVANVVAQYNVTDPATLQHSVGAGSKLLTNYLSLLESFGGNRQQALTHARMQAQSDASGIPPKFDNAAWIGTKDTKGLKLTAIDKIQHSGDAPAVAMMSPEVNQWFEGERIVANNSNVLPDADVVAAKFLSTHALINNQYVNTSTVGKLTPGQLETLSTAIPEMAKAQIVRQGLDKVLGIDPNAEAGKDNFGDINLIGVPGKFNKDGKGLFQIQVNGHILPEPFDLDNLAKQYNAKGTLTPEVIGQADGLKRMLVETDKNQGHLTTEDATLYKNRIQLYKAQGIIGSTEAKQANAQIEKANTRYIGYHTLTKIKGDAAYIDAHPLLKNMTGDVDIEHRANITLPNQRDSLIDPDLQKSVYWAARGDQGEQTRALALSIWGNKVTGITGDHIGIGYNMSQNPKVVKDDFSATGISRSFASVVKGIREGNTVANLHDSIIPKLGDDTSEKVLGDIKAGKKRLDGNASDALFDRQVKRSNSLVDKVLTPQVYHKMSNGLKSAYTVLGIATGDESSMHEAMQAVEHSDWEGLKKSLKNVPDDRKDSAVGLIRLMGHSTASFAAHFTREAVVDPQKKPTSKSKI